MDFPKSVPGIGLVNGQFIDEDPLAATPGSLIPSVWGNAVTLEVLNVIEAGGLEPDEADNAQLAVAIKQLVDDGAVVFATKAEAEDGLLVDKAMSPLRVFQAIAKVVTQATEAAFGWLKIATQTQVNAGTDDNAAVTAKKLAAAAQAQAHTAFTTAGTAAALTLTPTPAIGAYSAPQRFRVKFSQNSTPTSTINVSSRGGKLIKQYDVLGAKIPAVYVVDQLGDIEYDGTDFVLRDPLPGNSQATEAVLGSVKIATQPLVNAGLNDTDALTALKLAQKDAYETVVSDWTNISLGGLITVNHPWGVLPQLATLEMKCIVANNGFTVGQEFPVSMHGSADDGTSSTSAPTGVFWTTTQVTARMGAGSTVRITSPTSGNQIAATTNFQMRLRVRK